MGTMFNRLRLSSAAMASAGRGGFILWRGFAIDEQGVKGMRGEAYSGGSTATNDASCISSTRRAYL